MIYSCLLQRWGYLVLAMKLCNEQRVCNEFKYPEGNNCAASKVLFFVLHREKNKNISCVVRIGMDKTGI